MMKWLSTEEVAHLALVPMPSWLSPIGSFTPPPQLDSLFNNKNFMENVQTYNSMKPFTIVSSIDHYVWMDVDHTHFV